MSDDEKFRYRNPVTNIIEFASPQYADFVGLERWDGPTDEVEIDKVTGIQVAILPEDVSNVTADELRKQLESVGLPTTGKKDVLIARLEAYNAEQNAATAEALASTVTTEDLNPPQLPENSSGETE